MKKQIALSAVALVAVVALVYVQRSSTAQKPEPNSQQLNMPVSQVSSSPKATPIKKVFASKGMPFAIEYADNSPIKSVPLKNAKMMVKVYYYDNPDGVLSIKTNDNQRFGLKYKDLKAVAMEIISIDGEDKYKANCSGTTKPGHSTIKISCQTPEA